MTESSLISKVWNFANVLRDDGVGYGDYLEQMAWLRMLKDHIATSFHLEIDDLDYTPFDGQGGRGRMFQLFGSQMTDILDELNQALCA